MADRRSSVPIFCVHTTAGYARGNGHVSNPKRGKPMCGTSIRLTTTRPLFSTPNLTKTFCVHTSAGYERGNGHRPIMSRAANATSRWYGDSEWERRSSYIACPIWGLDYNFTNLTTISKDNLNFRRIPWMSPLWQRIDFKRKLC